ncbi:MAG: N-acetylmuramoyl-L-alanine amidase [Pikeienuella sp.]
MIRAAFGRRRARLSAPRGRRIGVALIVAALVSLGSLGAVRAEPALRIEQFTMRETRGHIELAVSMSAEATFSLFTLTDPYRVVIDLPLFAWAAGPVETGTISGIRALRWGAFRHDSGRIVVEMDGPMAVRRAALVPDGAGFAISVDLAPTSPDAFARSSGWPEGARWMPEHRQAEAPPGQIIVAIDPGHGGIDPGAVFGRLLEKDLTLEFAKMLRDRIALTKGLFPVMTREDDRFLPLRARIGIARDAEAHVFISLHTDSLASGGADGASLYTLDREGTDDAARAFAERENRADVLAGVNLSGSDDDVTRLLIELARRGSQAESVKLAEAITRALRDRVALIETRPHRRGNFFVLKAPDMPSVLIELGFLTSDLDRDRLNDPAWRAAMAEGIIEGILNWLEIASPGFSTPRG